jgi:hypothetical protein
VLINHDGMPIAHPEDKPMSITDAEILSNMVRKTTGMKDLTVNGVSARVYYTPIEDIDWAVALVVPKEDIWRPFIITGISLIIVTIFGIFAIYTALKNNIVRNNEQITS